MTKRCDDSSGAVPIPPPPLSKKKQDTAAKTAAAEYIKGLTGQGQGDSAGTAAGTAASSADGTSRPDTNGGASGAASRPGTQGGQVVGAVEEELGEQFRLQGSSSDEEEEDGERLMTPAELTRMLEGQRIGTPEWHRLKAKAAAAERQKARALWIALARQPDAEAGSAWSIVLVERAPKLPASTSVATVRCSFNN